MIITYNIRKLLSRRKIIVRFSCNQAPGVSLCHNPVKHFHPRLSPCSSTFDFPFEYCSHEWISSEYVTDPISLSFSDCVHQQSLFSDHCQHSVIRYMFHPADLFYFPPDPHLKCFQSVAVQSKCIAMYWMQQTAITLGRWKIMSSCKHTS